MDDFDTRDLQPLVRAFEDGSLPLASWTHRAHLAVCCYYVMHGRGSALERMRTGLKRFQRHKGILQTGRSGYHETQTRFWVTKVSTLMEVSEGPSWAIVNVVIDALTDKSLVLFHYTQETIMSASARSHWCEPDLRPLPGRPLLSRQHWHQERVAAQA